MIDLLRRACESCLASHGEAWLLSALTDRSFEEGSRAPDFAESCRSMRDAGLPSAVLEDVAAGINARFERAIRSLEPAATVLRNPSRVPDLEVCVGSERACIESKQIYDLTMPKYYPKVAEDGRKLREGASGVFEGELFQVVFFIQVPSFDYPRGRWYGNKDCKARSGYAGIRGIQGQYRAVMSLIGAATWPVGGPHVVSLEALADVPIADTARRWMDQIFVPWEPWAFDPRTHLRDASVGVALWCVQGQG